jgi:hypothetical protein
MDSLQNTVVTKLVVTTTAGAAGTSAITSAAIDTAGFVGIRALIAVGAVVSGAVTSFKWSDCDTSGGSYSDVAGSAITIADTNDDTLFISEVQTPLKRYMKVNISRATQNATIGSVVVELYGPRSMAVTADSSVTTQELSYSPADGTA